MDTPTQPGRSGQPRLDCGSTARLRSPKSARRLALQFILLRGLVRVFGDILLAVDSCACI